MENSWAPGETYITGILHPEHESPDFELQVKIADTQIRSMNNLLRAYGKFDVVRGLFSCYAELNFNDGKVRGYVKPLFRKLDVYDKDQDRDKDVLQKMREGAIEDMSSLLENVPREEVATKADISGKTSAPRTDTVQIVLRLIQMRSLRPSSLVSSGNSAPSSLSPDDQRTIVCFSGARMPVQGSTVMSTYVGTLSAPFLSVTLNLKR